MNDVKGFWEIAIIFCIVYVSLKIIINDDNKEDVKHINYIKIYILIRILHILHQHWSQEETDSCLFLLKIQHDVVLNVPYKKITLCSSWTKHLLK